MNNKISKEEAFSYSRPGMTGNYYQFTEANGGTTVAFAHFTGEHGERTIGEHSRIYYVLVGEAEFMINGEKFDAKAGDAIAIPSGGTYNLWPKGEFVDVLLVMELLDLDKLSKPQTA
jgi:mannose-6-phosphate isomerase-like protein (cupin superfamily)